MESSTRLGWVRTRAGLSDAAEPRLRFPLASPALICLWFFLEPGHPLFGQGLYPSPTPFNEAERLSGLPTGLLRQSGFHHKGDDPLSRPYTHGTPFYHRNSPPHDLAHTYPHTNTRAFPPLFELPTPDFHFPFSLFSGHISLHYFLISPSPTLVPHRSQKSFGPPWLHSPPPPQRKWRQGYRGRASLGRVPQSLRRPPSSPTGRSPAPWSTPCRRKSLPVGGGICVSFCVFLPSVPDSSAEKNILPQSAGLVPLPLLASLLGPRAPRPFPLGPGATPAPTASAGRLALSGGAPRLPRLVHRR